MHTWPEISFMLVIVGILALLAVPAFDGARMKNQQVQACKDCRSIIVAMRAYANEHSGSYPDGATANEAFRALIKGGFCKDESLFTSAGSPYHGDNKIGSAPDFADALKPGENHWALTRKLDDWSNLKCPFVFENPKIASWPPKWDVKARGEEKPGRVWKNKRICVGCNDGSINMERVADTGQQTETLPPLKDGKNVFEFAGPHEVLDVAR